MSSNSAVQNYPNIVERFGYSPSGPAVWRPDPDSALDFRDLSLGQASEHALSGRHLRCAGQPTAIELVQPDCPFAFIFMLSGKATIEIEGSAPQELDPLDSATRHGPGAAVRWHFSHDAEFIAMQATDAKPELFGQGNGKWVINKDSEDKYIVGDGPRKFFSYRDLGVAAATSRRIHIHVVRAVEVGPGGTGWHFHSMGQLFYVLRGWAELSVEFQPEVKMARDDAMCISSGMRHNVPAFSKDYMVLEMCVPADYDTVDAAAA
jgi:mannose-6-phosphate isomerase-like protein (cupin superfamily)